MEDPKETPFGTNRPRIPFHIKIAVPVCLTFVLLLSGTVFVLYQVASERIIQEMGRELMSVTATGALGIDGDELISLTRAEQTGSPSYRRIQEHLRRLKAANGHIKFRFLYTMVPTEKPGIWRYVVDSEDPNSPDFSPLGSMEDFSADPVWLQPLEKPLAEDELEFYPGWGHLISASAPIRDKKGRSVGILGMDASAQNITETLENFRSRALLCGLAGVLLSILVSYFLAKGLTQPIPHLLAGAKAVEQGDFNFHVRVDRNDEMGDIARALNQMSKGLKHQEAYRSQFGRYVSSQVADRLIPGVRSDLQEAVPRTAVILCSSFRSITVLAQRLPEDETMARLNDYLSQAMDILMEQGGSLDRISGDSFTALFGLPEAKPDDVERAVKAALLLQERAGRLAQRWHLSGFPDFFVTVGLHRGECRVSAQSLSKRSGYNAKGEALEVAAALEGLTQEFNSRILVSEGTLSGLEGKLETRPAGETAILGRDQKLKVQEILGWKG